MSSTQLSGNGRPIEIENVDYGYGTTQDTIDGEKVLKVFTEGAQRIICKHKEIIET